MSSGVAVDEACITTFNDFKLRKKKVKFITFKLSDDNKKIVIDSTSDDEDYEHFRELLKEDQCLYAVYDFQFEKAEGAGIRNKICFVSWSPDTARIKQKMLYASSKEAIRKALDGVQVEIQGADLDDVTYEAVFEKANKGS